MGGRATFLHGFLGAPSSWDRVIALLDLEARARWLPGHGLPPAPQHGVGFVEEAEALGASLDGELLVAYSMGARLGLAAVLAHPERVRGAVLIGVDPGLVDPSARAERIAIEEGWARTLEQGGLAGFVERWAELPIFATQTPALVEAQRGRRLAHDATAIARQVRRLGLGRMPEQWEGLSRCSVPLVVMAGDKDAKFVGLGRRIVEACPRARLELIEGAGHNLALEAPERVAAVIRDL